ncbi:hypothetical protein A2630_02160 [Candidatus Woesebacteria bacterium RIFCSPHIGHO2_01_FULL_44_10]|nr:MAG: hypothetical protein A2630_02160 [Candidatus Woesebacteria bacterium RIFCSPHIGHO2_01_FULL_44_10]OGM55772.1 MAG: hypothetical protein A3F62_04005 [Candidatus Woesebacteria bacterium RIFCSPHIGHO2_12_FULL_44_11]
MSPKISIVMPTYNEVENVENLIHRIEETLKKDFEIIVVDDNSPDDTAEIVRQLQLRMPYLRLIVRRKKLGLATAIQKGIKASRGSLVGWLDCAGDMPPEKFAQMKKKLTRYDVVVGSTFIPGGRDQRGDVVSALASRLINRLCQLVLGSEITDYTSGFILAKKETIDYQVFTGLHGSYFIKLLASARKHGFKIVEIPYTLGPRQHGESKLSGFIPTIKTGVNYLQALFEAKFLLK